MVRTIIRRRVGRNAAMDMQPIDYLKPDTSGVTTMTRFSRGALGALSPAASLGFAVLLALSLTLAPSRAQAQIDSGSIVGDVTDTQGGALPGATVVATQEGTGFSFTTTTNAKGQYSFRNLRIGSYVITAELSGFKKTVRSAVQLKIQETIKADFTLGVGAMTEEVTVSGEAPLLNTQTGEMGYSVDSKQLNDLPLLGRRYTELALLQTGVVPSGAGMSSRGEDTFFNSNGNFATWNNFVLDGGDNNSFSTNLQERTPQVIAPPVDALEEFKIQTRTYSAEFGRSAGAVVNASIKQVTNDFKGVLFGFGRDSRFNANTFANKAANRPKGKFDETVAGGVLGGPIVKDKLFFLVDYQATRTTQAQSNQAVVPTALMRTGNLVELSRSVTGTNPFVPAGCINPTTKVISPGCIDPVATRLMALYPLPNIASELAKAGQPGSFGLPNYINNDPLKNTINSYDVRLDARPGTSGKTLLFTRYSYSKTERREPPVLGPVASGDFASNIDITGQSAVIGLTRNLSSTMVLDVRGAWNKIQGDTFHPAFGEDTNAQVGLKGIPTDPRYSGGIPNTSIGGLTRLGGPFFRPQFQTSSIKQFSASLAWNRGVHSFKFGMQRRRDSVDYIDLRSLNGEMNFADARYTGSGIADFLLGLATQQRLTTFHEANLYTDGTEVFAQDSWRPTSKLSLNLGLRYEFFTPMLARDGIMTNIDPANGQRISAKSSGSLYERSLIHPDRNNFAPRFSFAYSANEKMVIRGGYGIYYQHTDRYGSESQMALNPPQLIDADVVAANASQAPTYPFRDGFITLTPNDINPALIQWRIQDPNQRTPIVHQFSIGPDFKLSETISASVQYVGNKVRNGRRIVNLNQGRITPTGVVFPYAQYGYGTAYLEQIRSVGRTDYNALQTQIQRRLKNGLGFTASFTYGSAKGDFLDHLSAGGGATGNVPQDVYNLDADYGPLEFDIKKRFVLSFIYEPPVGRGRGTELKGLGRIFNDWSVNGILSLEDGRPFTITGSNRSNTGGGHSSRANCLGDAQPSSFDKTLAKWFDTTQFADTVANTHGSCGINTVRGPGAKNLNMSLVRNFPLPNGRRIEFRASAFNLLDWENYGFPGSSVTNPVTFGVITGVRNSPREMQFAAKLYF